MVGRATRQKVDPYPIDQAGNSGECKVEASARPWSAVLSARNLFHGSRGKNCQGKCGKRAVPAKSAKIPRVPYVKQRVANTSIYRKESGVSRRAEKLMPGKGLRWKRTQLRLQRDRSARLRPTGTSAVSCRESPGSLPLQAVTRRCF